MNILTQNCEVCALLRNAPRKSIIDTSTVYCVKHAKLVDEIDKQLAHISRLILIRGVRNALK